MDQKLVVNPIGFFRSDLKNPYDLPRQPDDSSTVSCIELKTQQNFEQALDHLEQFDRIWVIYHFHHNTSWKPMTLPPRGTDKKIGVFSTRSPYRPNPIGLSCLRLLKIDGLKLWVEGADLMDETPILDIKPYIPTHDSFPKASMGWLENIENEKWNVTFLSEAELALNWLAEMGEGKIRNFIMRQLEYDPTNSEKKRVTKSNADVCTLAYRTWRIDFKISEIEKTIRIIKIYSAYSSIEITGNNDPYNDLDLHRQFIKKFL